MTEKGPFQTVLFSNCLQLWMASLGGQIGGAVVPHLGERPAADDQHEEQEVEQGAGQESGAAQERGAEPRAAQEQEAEPGANQDPEQEPEAAREPVQALAREPEARDFPPWPQRTWKP